MLKISDDRLCKIKMIGEIRQNFTEASASVGLILATALIILILYVSLLLDYLYMMNLPSNRFAVVQSVHPQRLTVHFVVD